MNSIEYIQISYPVILILKPKGVKFPS